MMKMTRITLVLPHRPLTLKLPPLRRRIRWCNTSS